MGRIPFLQDLKKFFYVYLGSNHSVTPEPHPLGNIALFTKYSIITI